MRQLLVGLLLTASPLAAQTDWLPLPVEIILTDKRPTPGEWMMGVDIGWSNFMPVEFEERGTRFVLFAERNVLPWLGAQVDLNCARGTIRPAFSSDGRASTVCAANLSGVIPIPISTRLWPYVRFGGGYATWDDNATEGFWNSDDTSPTFVIAAGTRYLVGTDGRIGLRFDVQRQQTSLGDLSVATWSFGFGVSTRLLRDR